MLAISCINISLCSVLASFPSKAPASLQEVPLLGHTTPGEVLGFLLGCSHTPQIPFWGLGVLQAHPGENRAPEPG